MRLQSDARSHPAEQSDGRSMAPDRPGSGSVLAERTDHHEGSFHRTAWVLRAVLVIILVVQLVRGNMGAAIVAAEGSVASLITLLVSRLSGWHVPWLLEVTFVVAMVLQFGSEALKLFELFTYWDKLIHPLEIFLASGVATYLMLGYRHYHRLQIPDGLAAAGASLFGMSLGSFWELVEFA